MAKKAKAARTRGAAGDRASSTRADAGLAKSSDSDNPNPVDVHVGTRVRQRRAELAMSQQKLGDAVGLTFQQIQKYERGTNRIGASRLFEFSTIMDVPIGYFYQDLPADAMAHVEATLSPDAGVESESAMSVETLHLVKSYYRIRQVDVRRRLYELVKAVAQESR